MSSNAKAEITSQNYMGYIPAVPDQPIGVQVYRAGKGLIRLAGRMSFSGEIAWVSDVLPASVVTVEWSGYPSASGRIEREYRFAR